MMNIGTVGHFHPRISAVAISVKMILGIVTTSEEDWGF